jgi:hypothetical protein
MALSDTAIRSLGRAKALQGYDRDGLFLLVNPNVSKLWRYRFDGRRN